MSRDCGRLLLATFWLSLLLIAIPGRAQSAYGPRLYLDIHPPGWLRSEAVCVNGQGQAAGYGMTPQGERAFLWSAGRHLVLLPEGAIASRASWVNDRGEVAGTAFDADGTPHAFLFRNGEYLDPTPGWRFSEALFVGNDGAVTGRGEHGGFVARGGVVSVPSSFDSVVGRTAAGVLFGHGDNAARMFIPEEGYLTLLPPGGETASPGRMNENGLATFSAPERGVDKGYVYSGGFMIFMTPPEWTSSVAESVNMQGEVVGHGDGPRGRRGFLRTGVEYEVISCPECAATEAKSVNDFGEVAGSGVNASGETRAFLSYPVSASSPAGQTTGAAPESGGGGCAVSPSPARHGQAGGIGNLVPLLGPSLFLLARRIARRRLTPR